VELLVIVLNKTKLLTQISDVFIEKGIARATVINSLGIGHHVADHIPFFSQYADSDSENKNHVRQYLWSLEEVLGYILKSTSTFLFSIPVNLVKGISTGKCGECT